jgi:probable phosphoglycerate mutase
MASGRAVRIYLARHAETGQNRDGVVQGRADNALSELGQRQAEALGSALAGEPLVAVYSSPLQRAQQTAAAIALVHGIAVTPVPNLLEMDIGEMEGLSGPELRERHAEFLKVWTSEHGATAPMPGGESLQQVQDRAGAALDRIIATTEDGAVGVVSHNFVVLSLLCRFLALPLTNFRRLRYHVAGLSIIEVAGDRAEVLRLNDVCHLERAGLLGTDPWQRRR